MIDERINKSLNELEDQLKEIESARKQVETIANSYNGLNSTTSNYVLSLNAIKNRLDEIVRLVGADYQNKVNEFEKEHAAIVKASTDILSKIDMKIDEITEAFSANVKSIQSKLICSLILNLILIITFIAFFLSK